MNLPPYPYLPGIRKSPMGLRRGRYPRFLGDVERGGAIGTFDSKAGLR